MPLGEFFLYILIASLFTNLFNKCGRKAGEGEISFHFIKGGEFPLGENPWEGLMDFVPRGGNPTF